MFMVKQLLILMFLGLALNTNAQNLVPNPSFEDFYFNCTAPKTTFFFSHDTFNFTNHIPQYWNDPAINSDGSASSGVKLLNRGCGAIPDIENGYIEPHDGNSAALINIVVYIGLSDTLNNIYTEFRSYAQTTIQTLQKDKIYYISFYVSSPTKNPIDTSHLFVTDNVGLYFSENRILNAYIDSGKTYLTVVPQITNPIGRYLSDTGKWQKVCGYYKANGGERWITIGNFAAKNSTHLIDLYHNPNVDTFTIGSALLIDMVSIIEQKPNVFISSKKIVQICDTTNIIDTLKAQLGFTSYKWNTGDTTPFIIVNHLGKYWVTVNDGECGSVTDTAYVVYLPPKKLNIGNDIIKCADNKPIILKADSGFYKYNWNTGDTTTSIQVFNTGTYIVNATYECGIVSDTINVIINNIPNKPETSNKTYCINDTAIPLTANGNNLLWYANFNDTIGNKDAPILNTITESQQFYYVSQSINNCESEKAKIIISVIDKPFFVFPFLDTIICLNDSLFIEINDLNYQYIWNDGYISSSRILKSAGKYILTSSNKCGIYSDSIFIRTETCDGCVKFPNAFSPNADGINDLFYPHASCGLLDYRLQIYNRVGTKVFESNLISNGWNGTYKNIVSEIDTYAYYCSYYSLMAKKYFSVKGNVTLIK